MTTDDARGKLIREATHLHGDPEGMADPAFMERVRPGYTASQIDDARAEKVAAARYLYGDPEGIGDPADFMASIRPARQPEPVDSDTVKSLLGEGLHTALRKASDHNEARAARYAIDRLPAEEWDAVLDFLVSGLGAGGYRLVRGDAAG